MHHVIQAGVVVVLQWLTAREDYHRLLKEIRLQGTRNNTNITHYYEYINFRADSQPAAVFDPCALAPKVTPTSYGNTVVPFAMC